MSSPQVHDNNKAHLALERATVLKLFGLSTNVDDKSDGKVRVAQ